MRAVLGASLTTGLAGLASVLGILATAEALAPQPAPPTVQPLATPRAAAVVPQEATGGLLAAIAARPLFRPDRRPVASRATPGRAMPRLSGILMAGNERIALFTDSDGKTALAHEGDTIGAYRITKIAGGSVSLAGAGAKMVLIPRFDGVAPPPNQAPVHHTLPPIMTPGRE
jgi:hypothetical protein